jgi:hypothetical protein
VPAFASSAAAAASAAVASAKQGFTARASVAASPSAGRAAATPASGDPGCSRALNVISKYGPSILQDAVEGKEAVDKAEIDVLVILLDAAANAAGRPDIKQSIRSLADAYLKFRGAWTHAIAPPVEGIVGQTNKLESYCT